MDDESSRVVIPPGHANDPVWGDFELRDQIGRGSMGSVYRGRQISLNRPVAIKVLGRNLSEDARFRKRFLREARAVAQVNSPHIVQIFYAGTNEGRHYYVMELVDGVDLARKLSDGLRLSTVAALDLMMQATRGLVAASRLGIVHRDIKPSNMLITSDGVLKLGDFGIAKLVNEGRLSSETEAGLAGLGMLGTPSYLSPEQATGAPCDHRSDIYSLGVVFYELLTGTLPFIGSNSAAVAYQHAHQAPRRPRELEPALHRDLEALVLKCLAKKPAARYQSAAELLAALEDLLLTKRLTIAPTPPIERRWLRPTAIAAAAVVAAAALVWTGTSLLHHHRSAGAPADAPSAAVAVDVPTAPPSEPTTSASTPTIGQSAHGEVADLRLTTGDYASGSTRSPADATPAAAPETNRAPAAGTVRAAGITPAQTSPAADSPLVAHEPVVVPGSEPARAAEDAPTLVAPPTQPQPQPAESTVARAPVRGPEPARAAGDAPSLVTPPTEPQPAESTVARAPEPVSPPADPLVAVAAPAWEAASAERDAERSVPAPIARAEPAADGTDHFGRYADVAILGQTQRFRWCPPGRFMMGSPDDERSRSRDEDIHQVTLTKGFWIADSECTQSLWTTMMESSPSVTQEGDHPVEQVSWESTREFLERLRQVVPGLEARLPTESEWEYACRAGGADADGALEATAWLSRNADKSTHPVKLLTPNAWGLFDMHGNVGEWCEDCYDAYPKPVVTDPPVRTDGAHIIRGGSYRDNPAGCRTAHRDHGRPRYHSGCVGFRLAASQLPQRTQKTQETEPQERQASPVTAADEHDISGR